MDENSLNSRLSRISTIWTDVEDAHKALGTRAADACLNVIKRYQGAAYRYLFAAVRDPDAADELFQEFALRVVQGAFSHADPRRGRFRFYLKTVLFHLVTDYQKRQRRRPQPLGSALIEPAAAPADEATSDQQFVNSWREEILARAWAALAEAERQGKQPYYSVLRFRAENPESSSAELAARLSAQLQPAHTFTEAGVRKTLQRARMQFADILIDEVARSLGEPTAEQLEQELIDLDLLPYCRSALARRKA
jgi:RNA polymerase sigma factor (sigma-70 family)